MPSELVLVSWSWGRFRALERLKFTFQCLVFAKVVYSNALSRLTGFLVIFPHRKMISKATKHIFFARQKSEFSESLRGDKN